VPYLPTGLPICTLLKVRLPWNGGRGRRHRKEQGAVCVGVYR
jgi:hypothetical protein